MPTELQELQLRVGLINEASDGLGKLRDELKQLSSGTGKQAMDKFKQEQLELGKMVKDLSVSISHGSEGLTRYIGKFGVAGAAMGAMAGTILVGLSSFKEFSDKIIALTNKAKVIGMDPAELKSLIDQYDRMGVSAAVVEQSMAGLSTVLAEVNRIGSQKRMEMIEAAGAWGELMDQGIKRIEAQTTWAGRLHEIMIQAQNVYDNRLKETNGNIADATKSENDFLKIWDLDPSLKVLSNFDKVTDEEKKRLAEQEKATAAYRKVVTDLGIEWENFSDDIKTSLLSSDGVIVSSLQFMVRIIKELHELWDKPWFGEGAKAGISAVAHAVPIVGPLLEAVDVLKGNKEAKAAPGAGASAGAATSDGQTFNERWSAMSAPPHAAVRGSLGQSWDVKDKEHIDDGLRHGDDYVKTIDANTKETKKLNDNFKLLDKGQVELKGLGGLPGFDTGGGDGGGQSAPTGGTAPGGGGDGQPSPPAPPTGGTAPNGSNVGAGGGEGAGESHPGSGTGGGVPAGSTSSTSDTEASGAGTGEIGPKEALAIARSHLTEDEIRDEKKLSSFFNKHGFKISPRTTAWCAVFVNSTLDQAGMSGTGSMAAASFYKYGKGVKGPTQAGDIAVWPHHVAMLTGETRIADGRQQYQVIGGNQGGTVSGKGGVTYSWRNAAGMTVRRPDWAEAKNRDGDRSVIDTADKGAGDKKVRDVNVVTNGKLSADVNAPRGSEVKVEGGGAFNKTEISRQMPLS